ncbi:kyphoscoliosis peptidase-like [Mya arenaria]|uniref:kyphoscoliosis peptidase-like n=1 Tax=Mya arenaria TaxID=6604 RepID=UPI0022E1ACE7|nr:kyphoscoliosis peptidase-like [Mya arenaria]
MGCPQSKSSNISGDPNDANDVRNRTAGKDSVQPKATNAAEIPRKTPHEYNDDPMVKGRSDDTKPPSPLTSTNENNKKTASQPDANAKVVSADENQNNNKKQKDAKQNDIDPNLSVSSAKKTPSSKKTFGQSETKTALEKENIEKMKDEKEDSDQTFSSVFVVDDDAAADSPTSSRRGGLNGVTDDVVDVNDVNIGQQVSEITLDTRMKATGAETSGNDDTAVEIVTPEGYTYREKKSPWVGNSPVRHVSGGEIMYGLPEGVPEPAPPKTRKSELVTPTTFTLADRLVDETPNDAFESVSKLAGYLTGTQKKSELLQDLDDAASARAAADAVVGNGDKNMPPPKPTQSKKKDIVTDVGVQFKHIDENAKNTPESCRLAVDRLAAHLASPAGNDVDKVRAFYFWICHNISYMYDKDKTLSDRLRYDATSTLRQGEGSYVNLMTALCKEVGIPAVTIPGCSKGLRHQPDKEFKMEERNHSWNAVHVEGEWRFIDCTWGSGFVDVNGKFQRQFDEFWFMTDPEIFCYDHFPAHPIWQLLERPIDIDEFNKKPSLTEKSRELGFQLISHREPIVTFDKEVAITFSTETYPLSNITADLRNEDRNEVNQYRCMRRIDEKTFEVRVVPPVIGEYTLVLFGKAKDYRHAKFRKLVEYTLRCESVVPSKITFPDHKKAWGPEPSYAELGFADSIQSMSVFRCDEAEMTIKLEQTKSATVMAELKAASDIKTELSGYTVMTAQENAKTVHIRFPSAGFYRLDVYAEGKSEKYEYAALFLLECTADQTTKKFPKYNADALSKHVCELIEPVNYEIPADSKVTFKIRSRNSKNVMIGLPTEESYGPRMKGLGELKKTGDVFSGQVTTPKAGEAVYISGTAAPPNVFWSRLYEYITV